MTPDPQRTETRTYFLLAFLVTWVPLVPPVLARFGVLPGAPEDWMAGAPLAIFGPAIAAVVVSARDSGRAGVRALLVRPAAPRPGVGWLLLALTLPGLLYTAGRAVYALVPGASAELPWVYPPADAQHIVAMVLVPIGEEIGWRGLALPRLVVKYGPRRATAILGLLWALWHLPMFLAVGVTPLELVLMLPFFLAGNVMFTWMFQRTGGSLLAAVLLHVGTHLDNPHQALATDLAPFTISTLAYVVFAAVLLVLDRAAFRRGAITGELSPSERTSHSP